MWKSKDPSIAKKAVMIKDSAIHVMKLNKRESLEIDLYIYGDSVYDKAGIQDLWERWGF